jgi:O-methyltransferase
MKQSKFIERAVGYLWRSYAPAKSVLPDIPEEDLEIMKAVKPFTMTSWERMYAVINSIRYIVKSGIPGDVVECGVWKGGSMMAAAKTLLALNDTQRDLYLFDTFAGMTAPSEKDKSAFGSLTPQEEYSKLLGPDGTCQWCCSSIEETRRNMLSVGYPEPKIHFVKGPVEKTIPEHSPGRIALLRLDTDFYESTRHEMIHLFPLLAKGGVLLLDDYGHWEGQRRAVDEYISEHEISLFMSRLDYTGRAAIKI